MIRGRAGASLLVAIGIFVFGTATLVMAEPSAQPVPRVQPSRRLHVDVIGDSLVRQSESQLAIALDGAGYDKTINSMPGMALGSPFVQAQLDALALPDRRGDILVVATSANDAVTQGQQAKDVGQVQAEQSFRDLLAATVDRFADRCMVVVNARENVLPFYYPEQAVMLNASLRTITAERPHSVIVDWAALSRAHKTDWFDKDMEHFGPDPASSRDTRRGARAYANAIRDGIHRCARRLGVDPPS